MGCLQAMIKGALPVIIVWLDDRKSAKCGQAGARPQGELLGHVDKG